MKPRLLLLAPTTTYRAQAFVDAARRIPVELSIASEEPSALQHLVPGALAAFGFSDRGECVSAARVLHAESPIHAVVPVDDGATRAAAWIAEALVLRGNPPASVERCIDKAAMRCALDAHGVTQPQWCCLPLSEKPALPPTPAYPVVVKPRARAASQGIQRADNEDELLRALECIASIEARSGATGHSDATGEALVEAFVPGPEIAVEALVSDGRVHRLAVFDKPDPLDGPFFPETIYVTPSRHPQALLENAWRRLGEVVSALGLKNGPVHAEFRGDADRVAPIEIAARSIGGLCSRVLRFGSGATLEDVILRHALSLWDEPPEREPRAAGVFMLQVDRSGVVEGVDGLEEASAIPGIEEIRITATPGRPVAPLPEGCAYPGFVFARADTPAQVEAALREAGDRIRFAIS